jgi:large conductance mechanosensitive channel
MLKGFKDFVTRGNVVELAVAVIMGVAFSGVIDSLSKDVITPVLGLIGGQPDFAAIRIGPILLGNFANALVSFVIKAAGVYFVIVLPFARFGARMAAAAPPNPQEVLLTEIRDLLARGARP